MQTEMKSVETAFGVKGSSMQLTGYQSGHKHQAFVPPVKPNYHFTKDLLRIITGWWELNAAPLWLWGTESTGKTSLLMQFAARMNAPVQLISCHGRLETPELIGRYVLNDEGGMDFMDGPLVTAMRFGHICILDEVDYLDPATAAGLNSLREGLPITIPETGETVHAAPGFRFAVTSNTDGDGDPFGIYPGTQRMNKAFMDGFMGTRVDYLPAEVEVELLQEVMPKVNKRVVSRMVDIANDVRGAFIGNPSNDGKNAINITMSTRSLLRWGQCRGMTSNCDAPFQDALDMALTWRANDEDRAFIYGVLNRRLA